MPEKQHVLFGYDPWRGGFRLKLSTFPAPKVRAAFDGFLSLHSDAQDRLVATESDFGDHGGLPLRGIHHSDSYPEGDFDLGESGLHVGSFQVRQTATWLELWFSRGGQLPRPHWICREDAQSGVKLWFSKHTALAGWPVPGTGSRVEIPLLAGIAVEFGRTTIRFPIDSIRVVVEDFK